jgi:hypothetical protein
MKKLLLFTLTTILIASACKKTECPVPVEPVNLGGTTFNGSSLINNVSYNPTVFTFNSDGSFVIKLGSVTPFNGSWSKLPNSSVVYFFFDESSTTKWKGQGTLNATNNKLEGGTFTRTAPTALAGTFTADKQ